MAYPAWRTKGELRAILRARLGFGTQSGANVTLLDSFLETAQYELFQLLDDNKVKSIWTFNLGMSEEFIDIPTGCDPDRIDEVDINIDGAAPAAGVDARWLPLTRGIDTRHDRIAHVSTHYPLNWDILAVSGTPQLRVWPIPPQLYFMRVVGMPTLSPFAVDSDRATIDDTLILMHAIAYGKAHYKKADTQVAMNQLNSLYRRIKAGQHNSQRYIKGDASGYGNTSGAQYTIPPIPKVI